MSHTRYTRECSLLKSHIQSPNALNPQFLRRKSSNLNPLIRRHEVCPVQLWNYRPWWVSGIKTVMSAFIKHWTLELILKIEFLEINTTEGENWNNFLWHFLSLLDSKSPRAETPSLCSKTCWNHQKIASKATVVIPLFLCRELSFSVAVVSIHMMNTVVLVHMMNTWDMIKQPLLG
jgi:hypothetical protein